MLKDKSDEELMLAYQMGDERAFAELYSRHSGRVFGFLRSKLPDEASAKDVLQGTFMKLHRSRPQYDPAFSLLPWLFTICRSELHDHLRKQRSIREDFVDRIPEIASPEKAPDRELSLAGLSPQQRHALAMRYEHDASFEEIAKALEVSQLNARQIVSRALRSLRRLYAKR